MGGLKKGVGSGSRRGGPGGGRGKRPVKPIPGVKGDHGPGSGMAPRVRSKKKWRGV
jgi:hypothetical protein